MAAKMAMMAMTTNNSISVKPVIPIAVWPSHLCESFIFSRFARINIQRFLSLEKTQIVFTAISKTSDGWGRPTLPLTDYLCLQSVDLVEACACACWSGHFIAYTRYYSIE